MASNDERIIIEIAKVLIKGLRAETIEDIGVSTVPRVVAGGKLGPVRFRAETGLQRERGELAKLLQQAGISRSAARAILLMHRSQPLKPRVSFNPIQQQQIRINLIRRAQYLLISGRRLQREIDSQKSRPGNSKLTIAQAMAKALKQEQRYYQLHLKASFERELAGSQIDFAAEKYGRKLGWYTIVDGRESEDCLEANGKNFYADKEPAIGWPGMTHPGCRCWAAAPHMTSSTVYGIRRR